MAMLNNQRVSTLSRDMSHMSPARLCRKVKKLFMTMDSSGDGTINKEDRAICDTSEVVPFFWGSLAIFFWVNLITTSLFDLTT